MSAHIQYRHSLRVFCLWLLESVWNQPHFADVETEVEEKRSGSTQGTPWEEPVPEKSQGSLPSSLLFTLPAQFPTASVCFFFSWRRRVSKSPHGRKLGAMLGAVVAESELELGMLVPSPISCTDYSGPKPSGVQGATWRMGNIRQW